MVNKSVPCLFLAPSTARGVSFIHGFTLIELLVCVGIIAILGSLSFAGIARARLGAQGTQCASNLRQIGAAAALWSGDHDGYIVPYNTVSEQDQTGADNWTGQLGPYLGREKTGEFASASELKVAICPLHNQRFGYGINTYLSPWSTRDDGSNYVKLVKLAAVPAPSKLVFMTDIATPDLANEWKPGVWRAFALSPMFGPNFGVTTYFGHAGDTANFLWLDGHVTAETRNSPAMDPSDEYWNYQYEKPL